MLTQTERQTRRRNMLQLWLLIALFALPPIAAWLFYLNPHWLPVGRTNHGLLIDPPREVHRLTLQTPEGRPFDWSELQDQWTLVVLAEGRCDAACIEQLIRLRQIRKALGANQQRIERLLILIPDAAGQFDLPNLQGLEGTRLGLAEATDKSDLLELFSAEQTRLDELTFLIDPRIGLMMMHDLSQTTSKQILQDLFRGGLR